MENATEALLIAAGILFTILILTLFVYMFNTVNKIGQTAENNKEIEQITAWNAEWEAYNKRYLYGTEVLTVINKAEENAKEHEIKVQVLIDNEQIPNQKEYVSTKKTNLFTCKSVEYSDKGRVNKMIFEFVE